MKNSVQQLPPVKKDKRQRNSLNKFKVIRSIRDLEEDEDLEQEFYDKLPDQEEYSK